MLIKKTAFIGSIVALFSIPLIANADLFTTNNTNEDSTVRVTSGRFHPCAGAIGQFTPAHGELKTPWGQVRGLCLSSGDTCTADLYMSRDCSGSPIGYAAMDLSHQHVTLLVATDPRYKLHIENNNHVFVDYADVTA